MLVRCISPTCWPSPTTTRTRSRVARYRSFLGVPIFREGRPIGVIGCGRREVKPFTTTQIKLVETFADQAAVALENARLFGELETRNRDLGQALEQQTATAEVLGVINSSPGDLVPVFEAILEKAHALCGIWRGSLQLYDGEQFRAVATRGVSETHDILLRQPRRPGSAGARLLTGDRFYQLTDLAEAVAQSQEAPHPLN